MKPLHRLAVIAGVFLGIRIGLEIDAVAWRKRTLARLAAGSRIAETPFGPLEYTQIGEGAPVLLLHGTPGGYDQGLAIATLFARPGLAFIAPSRPGYLRSPLSTGATPEAQADACAALLDRLNISRVGVVGVSGGGPAAIAFAARHPRRTSTLVLLEAIAQSIDLRVNARALAFFSHDVIGRMVSGAFTHLPPRLLPPDVRNDPEFRRIVLGVIATSFPLRTRVDGMRNDCEQFVDLSQLPLAQVQSPTLIVHGTADKNVPFAHAEYAARTIPGAQLHTLKDKDHTTTLNAPETLKEIPAFLAESYSKPIGNHVQ